MIDIDPYSPFNRWPVSQTLGLAVLSPFLLSICLLSDQRRRKLQLRNIFYIPLIIVLSFMIVNIWDAENLGFIFVYGSMLGLIITHLWVKKTSKEKKLVLVEFLVNAMIIIFFIPTILVLGLSFLISFLFITIKSPLNYLFPYFGEGTIGSLLVVSTLLSMYSGARSLDILYNYERINKDQMVSFIKDNLVLLIFECATTYACTTAAFAIMGGLITDNIPPITYTSIEFNVFSILLIIPYSLFLTRDIILLPSHSP